MTNEGKGVLQPLSIHRQDSSLWQSLDRCIAGMNQQHTTMIALWKYNGNQFVWNRITNLIECWRNIIRFSTLKLTKHLCTPATFIPRERLFSKTWINPKEKKKAFRHAVLNFKDCRDIQIEGQCLHHLWRWNWQSFKTSACNIQTPENHPKEYNIQNMAKVWNQFSSNISNLRVLV